MRTRISLEDLRAAFEARFGGPIGNVRAHGTGHIHDTFVLRWAGRELLVQRFNTGVFRDPEAVMRNIERVTEHLRAKLAADGVSDLARRVLRVVPAPDGAPCFRAGSEPDAPVFRAFEFIAGTVAYDNVQTPEQPFEAGRAFGSFAASLADLPAPPLIETIPKFHDTEARLASLRAAFEADPHGRAASLQAERDLVEAHTELAGYCARLHASGDLQLQVTHNDAKLSNLLFDAAGGEALCVVDLDTVMPGFPAYDFGDLVRTTACEVAEDARDPSRLVVHLDYIEALARGYLAPRTARGEVIREADRAALASGPSIFCYELGMRFLTDHLLGDTYFPIARPDQNLDRARVQFALLEALGRREPAIRAAVQAASAPPRS